MINRINQQSTMNKKALVNISTNAFLFHGNFNVMITKC